MSGKRTVEVGAQEYQYTCSCEWAGSETEIERWDVQKDRDRVVRRCPKCDEPIPEWGTFPSIDGVALAAKGTLRDELEAAGVYEGA